MNLGKSQYYGCDGTGRDTYIYNINGGFCPEKMAVRVEELGKYILIKKYSFYFRFIYDAKAKTKELYCFYSFKACQLY